MSYIIVMRLVAKKLYGIFAVATLFLSVIIFGLQKWLFRTWAELSADELLFHLKVSLVGTSSKMVKTAVLHYVIPGILVMAAFLAILLFVRRRHQPLLKYLYTFYLIAGLALMLFSCYRVERKTGLFRYLYASLTVSDDGSEDFIAEHYADPAEVALTFPETKRNLIFIYLESAEITFGDIDSGGGFETGCIPELQQIAIENEDFSGDSDSLNGSIPLPGSNWTMGAMFAQSSGLPLQLAIGGNGMQGKDSFFPNLSTLGDILEDAGYKQELLLGSDAQFGGRDVYYRDHGDYTILDYPWAISEGKIPEDYKVWWGFEDEKLYEYTKEELLSLSAAGQPFNLTLLNVDTHFPDGYICRLCGDEYGDDQYANVYACCSRQIAELLDWIKSQDFYENTTIILSGDHLTMDGNFCNRVDEQYERKAYFVVINGAAEPETNEARYYSTMDLFPTTLAAMGVEIEGDRLGLGVNLYSKEKTLLETYGLEECTKALEKPSPFMQSISQITLTEEDLDILKTTAVLDVKTNKNDKIVVQLSKLRSINFNNLKRADLEVVDNETQEVYRYKMKVVTYENNPNVFAVKATTDLPSSKMNDITVRFYFSAEGIYDYLIYEENLADKE
ncbi:MAG: sulfatase-like hydrolase/transferase [Erysipelotrichaceae bacterium]|nr:sulfatase-like hydrolase/transferase [Erysipelotrichaceae bacterium]